MDASDNPFRLVYTALWEMLENSPTFIAAVPGTGNRIRQDSTAYMYGKDALSDADLPQVRLALAGHKPHLEATSNDSFLDTFWEIEVATGDMRFASVLDVNWAIYIAMLGWQDDLMSLTWQSKTFVHLCRPLLVEEAIGEKQLSPGNRGWTARWRGEVRMHFTTADLAE